MWTYAVSRCSRATTSEKWTKNRDACAKLLFCLSKPIAFLLFLLSSSSSLRGKLPSERDHFVPWVLSRGDVTFWWREWIDARTITKLVAQSQYTSATTTTCRFHIGRDRSDSIQVYETWVSDVFSYLIPQRLLVKFPSGMYELKRLTGNEQGIVRIERSPTINQLHRSAV